MCAKALCHVGALRSRSGAGAYRIVILCAVTGALTLGQTASVHAANVDATLTTLLSGRADPRDGRIYTIVPAYQSLSLLVDGIDNRVLKDVRIVMRGFGQVVFRDSPLPVVADLDVAYIEGALFKQHLTIRLGRQIITGGVARVSPMDGLEARVNIWRGLGLIGYVGAPVTPRFGLSRGDGMVGGRLHLRYSPTTELAASFIQIYDRGLAARQDIGVDGRTNLGKQVSLIGYALWSLRERRLGEVDAALLWQMRSWAYGRFDYRRTAPDLFLPRTSVLAVFSQETRDEVGGSFHVRPINLVRVYGDYHAILNTGGTGHRGAIKVMLTPGRAADTQVGAEVRVIHLPRVLGLTHRPIAQTPLESVAPTGDGYAQIRFFGMRRLGPKLFVTLDLDTYVLERAINTQRVSFTAAATAAWDFHPDWRMVLTGIADTTPFVQQRVECMLKLVYRHTTRVREVQ